MLRSKRRPQRGYGKRNTRLVAGNNVYLPLAQQGFAAFSHRAARLVQGKHHVPLFENGRLRGINVLAYVFLWPQNAAGKRHTFSVHIVDGEHQPVPEAGVQISPFSAVGETGIYQHLVRDPLPAGPGQKLPRGVRSPPYLPAFRHVCPVSAGIQVSPGLRRLRGTKQEPVEKPSSLLVGHQQSRACLAPPFLRCVIDLLHNGDSGFFRQPSHGIRKPQVLHLHHKSDGRPSFPAAKAFKILPTLVHNEGRRLFIVERATCLPPGTGPFQGKIGSHHIYNVSGLQNAPDTVFINPSHKAEPVYHKGYGCTRIQNRNARRGNKASTGRGKTAQHRRLLAPEEHISPLSAGAEHASLFV